MTKKITSNRSTTLALLLNTLARFLGWLKQRNKHWLLRREEAIALQRYYSRQKKRDLHARRDWDILHENITLGEGYVVVEVLVSQLIEALERNPFPGEKKKVLEVAQELFPGATVILYPKVVLKGEKLWIEIFDLGEVDYRERLRFPVKDGEIDVAEAEKLLYENIREDGTIVAAEVPRVLKLAAQSKAYAVTRKLLQGRGWRWAQRREQGKKVKVVVAPSGTDFGP